MLSLAAFAEQAKNAASAARRGRAAGANGQVSAAL
jgi:hypothetical protein